MAETEFGTAYGWQRELNEALGEIRKANSNPPPAKRTIYFIRHAESRSNVAKEGMRATGRLLGAMRLCAAGFDSGLSDRGREQLRQVRPAARELEGEVQAVLYSPLRRATQTALTLLGEDDGAGGYEPSADKFWRPLKGLKETRFKEHAQSTLARSDEWMLRRVHAFTRFVALLPWETVALVGHSRFFRMMSEHMGANFCIRNANVWRVVAEVQPDGCLLGTSKALIAQPTPANMDSDLEPSDSDEREVARQKE